MAEPRETGSEDVALLLKHLLAVELWRGGLSQSEIKARLGLGSDAITRMLKGVSRETTVRIKPTD